MLEQEPKNYIQNFNPYHSKLDCKYIIHITVKDLKIFIIRMDHVCHVQQEQEEGEYSQLRPQVNELVPSQQTSHLTSTTHDSFSPRKLCFLLNICPIVVMKHKRCEDKFKKYNKNFQTFRYHSRKFDKADLYSLQRQFHCIYCLKNQNFLNLCQKLR